MELAVLIETYWNVNRYLLRLDISWSLRINRNILECKFYLHTIRQSDISVLIETYWNVNNICKVGDIPYLPY